VANLEERERDESEREAAGGAKVGRRVDRDGALRIDSGRVVGRIPHRREHERRGRGDRAERERARQAIGEPMKPIERDGSGAKRFGIESAQKSDGDRNERPDCEHGECDPRGTLRQNAGLSQSESDARESECGYQGGRAGGEPVSCPKSPLRREGRATDRFEIGGGSRLSLALFRHQYTR